MEDTKMAKENIGSTPEKEIGTGSVTVGGSGNIKLCPDGKYRWIYEFPMMKNPTILFTLFKVFAIVVLLPALIVFFSELPDGFVTAIVGFAEVYALVLAIMFVLSLLGYTLLAAIYGWKYIVLFEMDDKEVTHAQQSRQVKKVEAIGWISAFMGAATNNLTTTGIGLRTATAKNTMTTEFKNVSTVIGRRRQNTIKVNQLLSKNQVYVDPQDYDFVWEHITSRCKRAKIK